MFLYFKNQEEEGGEASTYDVTTQLIHITYNYKAGYDIILSGTNPCCLTYWRGGSGGIIRTMIKPVILLKIYFIHHVLFLSFSNINQCHLFPLGTCAPSTACEQHYEETFASLGLYGICLLFTIVCPMSSCPRSWHWYSLEHSSVKLWSTRHATVQSKVIVRPKNHPHKLLSAVLPVPDMLMRTRTVI